MAADALDRRRKVCSRVHLGWRGGTVEGKDAMSRAPPRRRSTDAAAAGDSDYFCVKSSLGRLCPSAALRVGIEDVAARLQILGGLWRRTSLQLRTRLLPGPAGEAPPPPGAEAPRPRVPHRGVSNLDDVQLLRERPAGRASLQDQRARAPASRREVGPLGGQEVRALP